MYEYILRNCDNSGVALVILDVLALKYLILSSSGKSLAVKCLHEGVLPLFTSFAFAGVLSAAA